MSMFSSHDVDRDLTADRWSVVDRSSADDDIDIDIETEPLDIALQVPEP